MSAYGTAFLTINNGEVDPAAGTSASVPVVAAMVTMCPSTRPRQTSGEACRWTIATRLMASFAFSFPFALPGNAIRLSRGEPPLGLLAPFLYSLSRTHPHAFTDVTEGDNRCRLDDQACCDEGFQATKGWVSRDQAGQAHQREEGGWTMGEWAPAHSIVPR